LLLAPVVSHASITVGSDLTLPAGFTDHCILSTPPCTHVLVGVHSGNQFPVKSPTDGVVKSFGIKVGSDFTREEVRFRLARLVGLQVAGAGTGPELILTSPGVHTVPANLAVQVGDYVGINTSEVNASAYPVACSSGAGYFTLHPPLVDFGSPQNMDSNSSCELLVNAVIQPTSVFGFNPKNFYTVHKGKIILPIELPGPGGLKVSGKGIARLAFASKKGPRLLTVKEAGTRKLRIKLAAQLLRRIDSRGKAALKVRVTFTPVGGDPGTQTKKLKLRAG